MKDARRHEFSTRQTWRRITVPFPGDVMTTPALRKAVAGYFSGQEWSLAFEVGNATGAGVSRHADAVAMNMWPSRGLTIHGIEMKISRGDWQRELANPKKAEEIHQYCDYWWLAAARNVVKDVEEIPPGWGFLELTEAGTLRVKRQATHEQRQSDMKRSFVAGMLRARDRADGDEFKAAVQVAADAAVARAIENERLHADRHRAEATQRLGNLTAALGEAGLRYLDDKDVCRAVAFVLKAGAVGRYGGLLGLIGKFEEAEKAARWAADEMRAAAEQFGVELPAPPAQAVLSLRRSA